ncbi:hypothetical protein N7493_003601 [Penicillium malachiteum]|uniref:INO80 complex subunit F domain-containing protein n=1 Tax=Penicillium malachiteum TaxID=1324776 RepID=A0AAD6HQF4_9EURO|nr:hypothetical protein N7493_003601 [Penicillium malachiteum]
MESRPAQSVLTPNAPSVERAYKIKCVELTRRLHEVQEQNIIMRRRNENSKRSVEKARYLASILLHRLGHVTAMLEEAESSAGDPESQARVAALLSNPTSLGGIPGAPQTANGGYIEDETEGSSDEQPPTPEERPLRVKRSRKSNLPLGTDGADDEKAQDEAGEAADEGSGALPRLAPAPSQQDLTSSFRVQAGSNGSAHEGEQTPHSHDNREGQSEAQAQDSGTTPMDMDPVEPKTEE